MRSVGKVLRLLVAAGGCLAMAGAAGADEAASTRVALPLLSPPPVIDGRIDEAEWRGAARSIALVSRTSGSLAARRAVSWIGGDGQRLYLALKSEVAPDDRLLARAVPNPVPDVAAVLHDDGWEVRLAPPAGAAGAGRVFTAVGSARGALLAWAVDSRPPAAGRQDSDGAGPAAFSWRPAGWQIAQKIADGWWNVEIAIPLASLGATARDLGRPWGIDLGRRWRRPAEESLWGAAAADDRQSATEVVWDPAAPVVRVLSLGEQGERVGGRGAGDGEQGSPRLELAVFNPHGRTLAAVVRLSDTWHRDPPRELRQSVSVPPGGEARLALALSDRREGLHRTRVEVSSPEGQTPKTGPSASDVHGTAGTGGSGVYYQRSFRWSAQADESRWTVDEEQKEAVTLQLKYYPYHDKIRLRASVEALSLRDRVAGLGASICRTDESGSPAGTPLWERTLAPERFVVEGTYDIPDLPRGKYALAVQLQGGAGLPRRPVVQPFAREVFPWEHNRLGFSDQVMPPFTPLAAEGTAVGAVLREHRHGPSGLWSQATSEGEPLLEAPMRWEVAGAPDRPSRAGAAPPIAWPVEGQGWRVVSRSPTRVRGQARWSAGPLRAEVRTDYDYDGMMRVGLRLSPTGAAAVGRLTLAIPLRAALARYMHAVGDGLRSNAAGRVPAGEGTVWDSNRAAKTEIVGAFYPYLWVGDGERGLCWFADTDRDWILDDHAPAVELVRRAGVLEMRVHFITRPGPLVREHRIVFGLQATPAKPMPDGWRRWTAQGTIAGGRPVRWLGANYYWGGLLYDVYPYRCHFEFYDKLREARQTGRIDEPFLARWMAMVARELAPAGSERYDLLEKHVWAGMRGAQSAPWTGGVRLFGYTNPRGAGFHVPEFATFQDEWLRSAYFNRNWRKDGQVDYDLAPAPSFQDYALWYYRKMLDCFDGVYWDNMYLSANFDPVVGGAWTDPQGRTHPGMGLWQLRELAKRTAIMLWRETRAFPAARRPPVTLAHMTNALLVPVFSFINCTMDWEWKYGYDDFQDRFTPELTVAETIGRQVGAWPTILAGGNLDPKDPRTDRVWRTRLGVCLAHEIQPFDWTPPRDGEIYARLYRFGYGTGACRVFNYWQPRHPVGVEGIRACTLALACRGAAMVLVTDYSGGGTCRLSLDLDRLGLDPGATAVDVETGRAVERSAPGRFVFPIANHDFRLLEVRP
jgi:hypothetical protein